MMNKAQNGFVLPYVLVAIAILSIAGTIAAQRLQRTSRMILQIQSDANAELAMMSAEAKAIFSVLTAVPIVGGLDLNAQSSAVQASSFYSQSASRENIPSELWSGAGQSRQTETAYGPVVVQYRDGAGLLPLNTAQPELIAKFLIARGIKSETARGMAAKLADYRDPDHHRRFRGGERGDYRLRDQPPPTNSPIRSFAELDAILGWAEPLATLDRRALMDATILSSSISGMKTIFVSPELRKDLGLLETNFSLALQSDGIEQSIAGDRYPSNQMRLSFLYRDPSGRFLKRVVEIERKINSLDRPFRKSEVYGAVVSGDEAASAGFGQGTKLKNVIFTPSNGAR